MRSRNPGYDADHVRVFPSGGRVEIWNDGEVVVYDPMDRDMDDFYVVPGDVPKLIRLVAEPMARWHHFMREMVMDEVSVQRRRRKNPSSFHAQLRAILSKARSNPMSRLRRRSRKASRGARRARKSSRRLTRKQRRAQNKAAWRKLQAKRRGRKTRRVARKSRYSRKARRSTRRRSIRRTSRGRFARKSRRSVRRTSRGRFARKSRRTRSRRGPRMSRARSTASIYNFAEGMAPGEFFGLGQNPRRRRRGRGRRRNPGVHHFKGGMVSYQDDGAVTLVSDRGATREYELSARDLRRFIPKVRKLKSWKGIERALGGGAILRQVNPRRRRHSRRRNCWR